MTPAVFADRFRPRPSLFLTTRSKSMNTAGLHDCDLVAIGVNAEPCNRKILLTCLDNEATPQRYRRIDEKTVQLHPKNSTT